MIGGLLVQLLVIYPVALLVIARKSPLTFFREVSEAMLVAFGTSTPTSITEVASKTCVRPDRNPSITRSFSSPSIRPCNIPTSYGSSTFLNPVNSRVTAFTSPVNYVRECEWWDVSA